mgnify:CR=1 FL=1
MFSADDLMIAPKSAGLAKTDIQICIPPFLYGRIAPRSGLAIQNMISVGGGVIDSDFRGNVTVILFNHGTQSLCVGRGQRIAQLIFEKIEIPILLECPFDQDVSSERACGGFGSTGK